MSKLWLSKLKASVKWKNIFYILFITQCFRQNLNKKNRGINLGFFIYFIKISNLLFNKCTFNHVIAKFTHTW